MKPWPSELADQCLRRLWAAVCTDGQIDPLTRDWLQQGLLQLGRDEVPLHVALGLAAQGVPSMRTRFLTLRRDRHLAAAVDAMALDGQVATWARCTRLQPLVRRFVADVWPRYSAGMPAPQDWPVWKVELLHAARTGQSLPTSTKGLYRSWTRNRAFSCPCDPWTFFENYL